MGLMSTGEHPPTVVPFGEDVLERMVRAAEAVRERLDRSTKALDRSRIEYALSGSNATAAWIESIDKAAVRQARNVELILQRSDFEAATTALENVGFKLTICDSHVRFFDGLDGRWRDAIEITFAGEPAVRKSPQFAAPQPNESETVGVYTVLRFPVLVAFQLARFRLDDAVDIRDMIDVGLIDHKSFDQLPAELASRLQELLDNPDG